MLGRYKILATTRACKIPRRFPCQLAKWGLRTVFVVSMKLLNVLLRSSFLIQAGGMTETEVPITSVEAIVRDCAEGGYAKDMQSGVY